MGEQRESAYEAGSGVLRESVVDGIIRLVESKEAHAREKGHLLDAIREIAKVLRDDGVDLKRRVNRAQTICDVALVEYGYGD